MEKTDANNALPQNGLPYQKPVLEAHGNIADIVQAVANQGLDDGGNPFLGDPGTKTGGFA